MNLGRLVIVKKQEGGSSLAAVIIGSPWTMLIRHNFYVFRDCGLCPIIRSDVCWGLLLSYIISWESLACIWVCSSAASNIRCTKVCHSDFSKCLPAFPERNSSFDASFTYHGCSHDTKNTACFFPSLDTVPSVPHNSWWRINNRIFRTTDSATCLDDPAVMRQP